MNEKHRKKKDPLEQTYAIKLGPAEDRRNAQAEALRTAQAETLRRDVARIGEAARKARREEARREEGGVAAAGATAEGGAAATGAGATAEGGAAATGAGATAEGVATRSRMNEKHRKKEDPVEQTDAIKRGGSRAEPMIRDPLEATYAKKRGGSRAEPRIRQPHHDGRGGGGSRAREEEGGGGEGSRARHNIEEPQLNEKHRKKKDPLEQTYAIKRGSRAR